MAIVRLISVLAWLVAGASLYLFVLNRSLLQMRDGPYKSPAIRTGAVVTAMTSAFAGYLLAGTGWIVAPLAVLAVAGFGEVRRLLMRLTARGQPPSIIAAEEDGAAPARKKRRNPATTTDFTLLHYGMAVSGWRGPALRIAHVSDFHLNSHLPLGYFEDAMRRVAAAQPDLLLFTGDFVTYPQFVHLIPQVVEATRGRLGTFAVLGNHDYWVGPEQVADAVRSAGVVLLNGEPARVAADGHPIMLAGCEHPWSAHQLPLDVGQARAADSELRLVLTHTPDNIYRLSRLGYHAVFAGHYHAGQMRLPLLGPLVVPSRYGRRFDHGRFVVNGTHLFVTAGVGSAEPPVRLWCRPDALIIDVAGQGSA